MTLKKFAFAAAVLTLVGATATLLLPRQVRVERSAVLSAPAEEILNLAASNSGFQTFNPYKTLDPDLEIEVFGPSQGVGSGFHFDGKDGTGTQTVARVTHQSVTYAIDLGALGQPTQSLRVLSVEDGTRVTWSVETDAGFNPLFRVFGLFMDSMMGPVFELGLTNLSNVTA